jgi:hypothetical protein
MITKYHMSLQGAGDATKAKEGGRKLAETLSKAGHDLTSASFVTSNGSEDLLTTGKLPHRKAVREITTHRVNGVNDGLAILVMDAPGSGGANHVYRVALLDAEGKPDVALSEVHFQNGPIKEAGINGLTHEVLLAIVADRLEGFQAGPYACAENQQALDAVKLAMEILQKRTAARAARGVEGTQKL